jgi:hypothetical protein
MKLLALFLLLTCTAWARPVHVRSHVTKRGTYVPAHNRTSPDHTRSNNWSTRGNTNPYTGKRGHASPTKRPR